MITGIEQPLGPFLGSAGELIPGGALQFLEKGTDVPKSVYLDEDLTTPAANPAILGSDSCTSAQIFLAAGQYTVRLFELVDPSVASPVFPDDYSLIREWDQDGAPTSATPTGTSFTVGTIAELTALDPAVIGSVATVLGYYDQTDRVAPRTYSWNASSVAVPDGGSVIPASGYATGRWELKFEGDVVDVRWFGALPGSVFDVGSSLTAAAAYAAVGQAPRTLYFPFGVYRVAPGNLSVSSKLKMDRGVQIYVSTAGDYIVYPRMGFEINLDAPLNHPGGTGTAYLDFTFLASDEDLSYEVVDLWYDDIAECIQHIGTRPLLVTGSRTVSDLTGDYTISKARFTPTGKLTHNHTGTVTYQGIEAQTGQEVIAGGSVANPMLAFECDARVSWLDAAALRFASVTAGHVLIVDADDTLAAGAPAWGRWEAAGGVLRLLGTETVNAVVDGPCVRAEGVLTAPYIAEEAYIIADAASHTGFVKSRAESGFTHISYQGKTVGYDLDLSALNYYFIILQDAVLNCTITVPSSGGILYLDMRNVEFSGAVSGDEWYIRLYDSSFAAATMTTGTTDTGLEAYNSTLALPETGMSNLKAKGSTLSLLGNVGVTNRLELRECSVGASTAATELQIAAITYVDDCVLSRASLNCFAIPGSWDVRITNSQFNGSFIKFTGTGASGRIMVRGNEFANLDLLTLYEPIDDSAMILSALTGTAFYIGSNSPGMPAQDYTVLANHTPTTGVVVKQTHNRLLSTNSAATWSLPIRGGSYWFGKGVPSSPAGFFTPHFARCSSEFNQPTEINYLQGAIDKVSGIQTVNGEPGIWQSVEIDLYQH